MVAIRILLDLVIVIVKEIKWKIKSLSENPSSDRLSSAESKYCCTSSELLEFLKPACVSFK